MASGFRAPRLGDQSLVAPTVQRFLHNYDNYGAKIAHAKVDRMSRFTSRLAKLISVEQTSYLAWRHFKQTVGRSQTRKSARRRRSKRSWTTKKMQLDLGRLKNKRGQKPRMGPALSSDGVAQAVEQLVTCPSCAGWRIC